SGRSGARDSGRGWRRRGELREVGKPEALLDFGDLAPRLLEAVLAELAVLDLLELLAGLGELVRRERLLPGREQVGVLPGRVVVVHQGEALEHAGERLGVAAGEAALLRD